MALKLAYRPRAQEDLETIYRFIAQDSPTRALYGIRPHRQSTSRFQYQKSADANDAHAKASVARSHVPLKERYQYMSCPLCEKSIHSNESHAITIRNGATAQQNKRYRIIHGFSEIKTSRVIISSGNPANIPTIAVKKTTIP
jgi:hypothetical protein